MKKTIVQKENYTQQHKIELEVAVSVVRGMAKISADEHNKLLFEMGCLFVETWAPSDRVLLTDPQYKFWDFWYYIYIKDDQNIVNTNGFLDFDYKRFKLDFVNDEYTQIQFDNHFYGK